MITLNEYKKLDNEYQERDNLNTIKLAQELATLTDEDIKLVMNDNHLLIMLTANTPINFRYLEYQKQYSFGLWDRLIYINYEDKTEIIDDSHLVDLRNKLETIFNKKDISFTFEPMAHFRIKDNNKTIILVNKNYAEKAEAMVNEIAIGYEGSI